MPLRVFPTHCASDEQAQVAAPLDCSQYVPKFPLHCTRADPPRRAAFLGEFQQGPVRNLWLTEHTPEMPTYFVFTFMRMHASLFPPPPLSSVVSSWESSLQWPRTDEDDDETPPISKSEMRGQVGRCSKERSAPTAAPVGVGPRTHAHLPPHTRVRHERHGRGVPLPAQRDMPHPRWWVHAGRS